jgi:hypothetical protein
MSEEIHKDATGVVDKIAEALGNEDGVDVAGSGLLELVQVVIGEGSFERDFDGGGGPIGVGRDTNGHGLYGFTLRGLFRVGAAGEDGEGAVELLGEHDAGEFVRKGHGAERKSVVGARTECVREPVGIAAKENKFTSAAVAKFAKPFGEGVGIEVFSSSFEKSTDGSAVGVEFLESGGTIADLGDLNRAPAADAFDVILKGSPHFGAARFSEHENAKFHFSPYFLRCSRRVFRLMPRAWAERLI